MDIRTVGNSVSKENKVRRIKSPMHDPPPVEDPRELFDFVEMYVSADHRDFSSRTIKLRVDSFLGAERCSRSDYLASAIS